MSNTVDEHGLVGTEGQSTVETTVLIVDDHPRFAALLSAALATVPGIRCVGTAASAAEGIQRVQELSPSVVVMDIQMPGTDGLAATRRLLESSPQTAVAVVSAHADEEWIARALQAGASAFIPKSGSLTEMIAVLKNTKPGPMKLSLAPRASTAPAAVDTRTRRTFRFANWRFSAVSERDCGNGSPQR